MKSESSKETWELAELVLCDVRGILSGRKTLDEEQEILRLIRDNLQVVLERTRKAAAREAVLQAAIDNLCELQERQEEKEEGQQGPYPDWGEAWEQAFAVRYGASQAGAALLEQLEAAVEREAVLIQELSFWSNVDELEDDLVNPIGDGWKCWLSGEQRDHANRAQEICSALKEGQ